MSTELALLCILAAVTALLIIAQWARIPYPILLVLGGLGLALAPGIPDVVLEPELVLLIILPPLLYAAAYFTPLRELRRNVAQISMLAVGLVLATAAVVAVVAHEALGFDWAPAFVLGAIVSPTDPIAATAIARRLGAPARIVAVVEGESLINDGTALVAYKFAVAAVVTGSFSALDAGADFVVTVIGGIAVGIAVGALIAAVRRRLDNPPVEVTIALLSAYFAYLPAEAIGVSGILAAVTVGIYMGRLTSTLTTPTTRIQGHAVWEIVSFLLNSALFVLVGLQLPTVIDGLGGFDSTDPDSRRGPGCGDRDPRAPRLGLPARLSAVDARAAAARARARPVLAGDAGDRLDRDARRRLARRGARAAARDRCRRPLPRARR